jgi:hypothetical protein
VVWCNLDVMLRGLGRLVVFDTALSENAHLERILAVAVIVGGVRVLRRSGRLQYPAAAAGMTAVLLVYHYTPDERLCLPLFPLILMGFWTEAKRFWEAVCAAWRKRSAADRVMAAGCGAALAAVGLLVAASYVVGDAVVIPSRFAQSESELAGRQQAYEWLRRNTEPGSTVYAYDDPVLYLYTGRRALGLPMPYARMYHPDPSREANEFALALPENVRQRRLDYLFLTGTDFYREQRQGLTRHAAARDSHWCRAFDHGDTVVYRPRR